MVISQVSTLVCNQVVLCHMTDNDGYLLTGAVPPPGPTEIIACLFVCCLIDRFIRFANKKKFMKKNSDRASVIASDDRDHEIDVVPDKLLHW